MDAGEVKKALDGILLPPSTTDSVSRKADYLHFLTNVNQCNGGGMLGEIVLEIIALSGTQSSNDSNHLRRIIERLAEEFSYKPKFCLLFLKASQAYLDSSFVHHEDNPHLNRVIGRAITSLRKENRIWSLEECFVQAEIAGTEAKKVYEECVELSQRQTEMLQHTELDYLGLKVELRKAARPDEEWCRRAIQLSAKCCTQKKFLLTKNLLLVTETLMDTKETKEAVQNGWTALVLALMQDSVDKYSVRMTVKVSETKEDGENDESKLLMTVLDLLTEDDLPIRFASNTSRRKLPTKPAVTYETAKEIFMAGTPADDPLDQSILIEHLAFFDAIKMKANSLDRQSKFHRRRVLLLRSSSTLPFINPARLMMLGSAITDMANTKIKLFEKHGGEGDAKLLQKMAYYCNQGIEVYKSLLAMPVNDCDTRVQAWFAMAQLQNKFFSPDRSQQMQYAKEAIASYFKVIQLCRGNAKLEHDHKALLAKSIDVKDLLERQVKMQP